MADLRDVVVYLCKRYPHKHELSKARLTKMVYLADWRSAITRGRPITSIEWEFTYYGPYVPDVLEVVQKDPAFEVVDTLNMRGGFKQLIRLKGDPGTPSLTAEESDILDFVINTTSSKNWNDFIRLIYSTYPIVSKPRFSKLDLVKLAESYKAEQGTFEKPTV